MTAMQRLCYAISFLGEGQRNLGESMEANMNINFENFERIQQDAEETVESDPTLQLPSLDEQQNHDQGNFLIDALVVPPSEHSNHVTFDGETVQQDTTVQPDTYFAAEEEIGVRLPAPASFRAFDPDAYSLADVQLLVRQETFAEYIVNLRQRVFGSRPTEILIGNENKIREILKPVTSALDELDELDELGACFCGEPYADTILEIEEDSHEAVKMPECAHVFGKHCIVQWLKEKRLPTCPMCRKPFQFTTDVPVEKTREQEPYRVDNHDFFYHFIQN